jgi:hypothetical protein
MCDISEKIICKCCGKQARWCGEGGDGLDPHDCDHIHCDHCGMHYSLEAGHASVETIEELKVIMITAYNGVK